MGAFFLSFFFFFSFLMLRGLKKNDIQWHKQTSRQKDIQTSRLYDWIGPVGPIQSRKKEKIKLNPTFCTAFTFFLPFFGARELEWFSMEKNAIFFAVNYLLSELNLGIQETSSLTRILHNSLLWSYRGWRGCTHTETQTDIATYRLNWLSRQIQWKFHCNLIVLNNNVSL